MRKHEAPSAGYPPRTRNYIINPHHHHHASHHPTSQHDHIGFKSARQLFTLLSSICKPRRIPHSYIRVSPSSLPNGGIEAVLVHSSQLTSSISISQLARTPNRSKTKKGRTFPMKSSNRLIPSSSSGHPPFFSSYHLITSSSTSLVILPAASSTRLLSFSLYCIAPHHFPDEHFASSHPSISPPVLL